MKSRIVLVEICTKSVSALAAEWIEIEPAGVHRVWRCGLRPRGGVD